MLAVLLLLPFFAVQLFAPDTMPRIGPEGLRVVLCSESGLQTVILDSDGTPHPVDDHDHHPGTQPACPWAVAAIHAFVVPVAAAQAAPFTVAAASAGASATPLLPPRRPAQTPPARGPPAPV